MRPKLISLLAVSALALVGCTAAESTPEPQPTVTVTAAPSASAEGAIQESGDNPGLFLKSVNYRWIGEQQFSDADLLNAGRDACNQMRDGADVLDVESDLRGISEENQDALAVAAQDGFCSDLQRGALKPSEIPDPIAPATN